MLSSLHAIQASQASATDLRLWSAYVQLLALLGNRVEAIKVAEKALSMLQVRRFRHNKNIPRYITVRGCTRLEAECQDIAYFIEMTHLGHFICFGCRLQALPEDKKVLSAELFWLAFRLHAGLPLSPRDPHAGVDMASDKTVAIGDLFETNETQGRGTREMALLVLCSFAEGSFKRPKTKKSKVGYTIFSPCSAFFRRNR